MSWRSMRLASDTSSSAVSSGTLPISLRYMRTGSLVGVLTERSSLGMTSSSGSASARPAGGCLVALDDVDAEVVEEDEDVVDLVGRQIDVLQHVVDVVGVQVALLAALGDELVDLLDGELRRCPSAVRSDGSIKSAHFTLESSLLYGMSRIAPRESRVACSRARSSFASSCLSLVSARRYLEPRDQPADDAPPAPAGELLENARAEDLGRRAHHDLSHGTVSAASSCSHLLRPRCLFPCGFARLTVNHRLVGLSRDGSLEKNAASIGARYVAALLGQRKAAGQEAHLELVRAHQDALFGERRARGAVASPAARRAPKRAPRSRAAALAAR